MHLGIAFEESPSVCFAVSKRCRRGGSGGSNGGSGCSRAGDDFVGCGVCGGYGVCGGCGGCGGYGVCGASVGRYEDVSRIFINVFGVEAFTMETLASSTFAVFTRHPVLNVVQGSSLGIPAI